MDVRCKQRAVIEFLYHEGIKEAEIVERLRKVYKDKALSQATVWRWLDRFKSSVLNEDSDEENIPLPCLQSIGDKRRSGRPLSALTPENKQKADEIIHANRPVTIGELSIDLDISVGSAQSILKSLDYRKVCAKWVPKNLTEKHKRDRVQCCRELRQMVEVDPQFFERFITGDETWVYYYDPETKQQSMEWRHPGSPTPKKPRGEKSSQKMLATVFRDIHGIICIEFLPRGSTIDSDRYIQTLKKLKARIYRARPALEMQRVLFHHDNAPPHTSGKTRETIASMGWKTLPHPPYSPDLAPSDYHLFGPMKLHMKGMRHENDDDLKTTVTKWLREQPPEFYRQGILALTERWAKAITRHGEYIED